MRLVVISSPDAVADESTIINNLFGAGLQYFHIRKPNGSIKQAVELIEAINPAYYNRISLHQFHEIAPRFGIKRLHYTSLARKASNLQKWEALLQQGYFLSTSVHNVALLPQLTCFGYVFYGPVFNSISKPGYQSNVPAGFKLHKSNIETRVIALGGIDETNLLKVNEMNFDGAAILGAIWSQPHKAISHFNKLTQKLACLGTTER